MLYVTLIITLKEIEMANFNEIINQNNKVLIDFFATWCGPCKAMSPILQDLKKELGDKLTIIKIDVDKNTKVATNYNVQGVPTFILFENGKQKWRQSGMITKTELLKIIHNLEA